MMVSYRKKYSPQVESPPRDNDDAPVVASPRPSAAAPPATAVDHPEPPVLEERPPEEVAAKNAIQERLREMTEAEAHARQPVEQRAAESSSRQTPEEFIDHLDVPETTKKWLKRHPEVVTDSALGQEVRALHNTARRRAGGEEFSENYFRAMDDLLGFEPAGNGRHLPPSEPVRPPYNGAPPRAQAPTPRPAPQRFTGQPPAAPPTREVPSMRTGRPSSETLRPTPLDHEGARISGISVEEYMRQKARMLQEKAAGLHGGG